MYGRLILGLEWFKKNRPVETERFFVPPNQRCPIALYQAVGGLVVVRVMPAFTWVLTCIGVLLT